MSETLAVHLVDDDAGVAEACRYLLEGLGLAVIDWRSGEDFLAGVNLEEPPGCSTCDCRASMERPSTSVCRPPTPALA